MSGVASLFGGGKPKVTPLPALPKPEPIAIPSPTDPAAEAARRKALADAAARKGRASTILTDNSGITPPYSNTLLGS